jgi:uncharacterized membrane protein
MDRAGDSLFYLQHIIPQCKIRMAIFTMIATALYLFLVDFSRISLIYRVVAFLFLAIISITISLYYVRPKKGNEDQEESHEDSL